jgi:hypothetical protein
VTVALWREVLRARRGQSLVEVAFSLWIFTFMGLGLMEGAMLAWNIGTLQHAVEDGARYALRTNKETLPRWPPGTWPANTPMDETEVKQAVVFSAYGLGLATTDVQVWRNGDAACTSGSTYAGRQTGDQLRVCATYIYNPLFIGPIIGSLSVTRLAQIRVD